MRAAELLHKAVVTPASTNRALCADLIGDEFENCACVIIQPAYDARVDGIFDVHGVEISFDIAKMRSAIIA